MTHTIAEVDFSTPGTRRITCSCGTRILDATRDDYALEDTWAAHTRNGRQIRTQRPNAAPRLRQTNRRLPAHKN